jgi:uncharacterized repeat protein (TIGR03987 family)
VPVLLPVIVINLALVFYSIGVWSERFSRKLKLWHLVFFWCGIVCDTWGTGLMFQLKGRITYDVHGVSGLLAIVLMLVHAIWATFVIIKKDTALIANFHKFSLTVWGVWLIPYLTPMTLMVVSRFSN